MPQSFDVAAARRDGVTDQQIAEYLAQQSGFDLASARRDGVPDAAIVNFLTSQQSTPPPSSRPEDNPGIMAGLNDFKESVIAGAQRLRTMPEGWGNIAEGIRGGALEDYPIFGPIVAPVVDFLSDPGAALFGEPTADRADRQVAAAWAQGGREGVDRAYARQTPERQYERQNDPWYTGQNLLHLGGEQIPQLAISGAGGLGSAALRGGAAGAMAMSGMEGLMTAAQINEGVVQDLMAQGYGREEAVRVAALPSMAGGLGTSMIGAGLGRFESDLFSGAITRGVTRGAVRGVASEGIEEGLQSGQEQFFQNVGVRGLDPTRGLFEGVPEAAAQGAVLGGIMGGGIGGVAGAVNRPDPNTVHPQLAQDMREAFQAEAQYSAQREAARPAAPPAPTLAPAGSLTHDRVAPQTIPPMPLSTREGVDQVSWRESVAPVLDAMAQGNYETLLQEQQERDQAIERARLGKKRMPKRLPDPIPPRPESQLKADPFTPEMGAELIRSAEAGPVTASMLKDKGIPRPSDTLKILERRGFLKQTGVQENTTKLKNGKTRTTKEPVYESTAAKPPEVAGPGEASELYIKPVPVREQAPEGGKKGPTPQAIKARFDIARARADATRGKLAALPQIGEDWSASRVEAMEGRRSALEAQLQQDEFEVARAQTGRAAFAVVEKIAAPDGAPRENVVNTFTTRQEAQKALDAKQGRVEEIPVTPEKKTAGRDAREIKALTGALKQLGLDGKVILKIEDHLDGAQGYAETSKRNEEGQSIEVLMALAREVYDPALSDAENLAKMVETLHHEATHALQRLGLFTTQEWNLLGKEARARKRDDKDYTYLQWAYEHYHDVYTKDGKPDMDAIVEEAVAEMVKDWYKSGGKLGARYTGLMNKIIQFLKKLLKMQRADNVLDKVVSGEVGSRERQVEQVTDQRMYSAAETIVKDVEEKEAADAAGPPEVPSDRRFMFAGDKSRLTPWDNYTKFLDAELAGVGRAKIYEQTGWYRGMDNRTRYEISDSDAVPTKKFLFEADDIMDHKDGSAAFVQLDEAIEHEELFAAYPFLRELIVRIDKGMSANGSLQHRWKGDRRVPYMINVKAGRYYNEQLSTILHEIQHAIQTHEDWNQGGNDKWMKFIKEHSKDHRIRRQAAKLAFDIRKGAAKDQPLEEFAKLTGLYREMYEWERDSLEEFRTFLGAVERGDMDPEPEVKKQLDEEVDAAVNYMLYHTLAGEVEARNTQTRIDMLSIDRRRVAPWRTQDVPENKGLVLLGDEVLALGREAAENEAGADTKFSLGAKLPRGADPAAMKAVAATTAMARAGMGSPAANTKEAMEIVARYTVVQDYLAKGARMSFGRVAEAGVRDVADRLTSIHQDKMFPLRRLVSEVAKHGGRVTDTNDPVLADTLYPRRVQHKLDEAQKNLYRPAYLSIQAVQATEAEVKDLAKVSKYVTEELEGIDVRPSRVILNAFMMARHAIERNAFIREQRKTKTIDEETGQVLDEVLDYGSGMTDAEATAILEWFGKYSKQSKVKDAAQKVEAIIDYTRVVREVSGLSPRWDDVESDKVPRFKHYVPLRGHSIVNMEEDWDSVIEGAHLRTGKAWQVSGKEDMAMAGRQSYAGDILANVLMQSQEALVRSEKVKVGQALSRFVDDNPELTKNWLVKLKEHPMQRVVADGKTRMSPVDVKKTPGYFLTKENGKDVIFEVRSASLGRALTMVTTFGTDWLNRALSFIAPMTRNLSKFNTSYNIDFPIKNFLRDVSGASIQSLQYSDKVWAKISPKAFAYAKRGGAVHFGAKDADFTRRLDRLNEIGGLTGLYGLNDIESQMRDITREFNEIDPQDKGAGAKAVRLSKAGIGKMLKYIEDLNDVVESATRLAVFESFVEEGYSEQRAAQIAKELTVNFNRKGEWSPQLNALFMFFNAATQGQFTLLQAATSKRVQGAMVGLVVWGFVQEMLMSALSPEDEYGTSEYDKIEPFILNRSAVIMLGGGNYYEHPLPLGYNVLHTLGRRMARVAMGKDEPIEAATGVAESVLNAFNPFGGSGNLWSALTPSIIKPLVEANVTNEDFTGRPVHPEGMPGLEQPASQSFFPSASEGAKTAADALSRLTGGDGAWMPGGVEIHPDDIDHIMGGYLGGMGRSVDRVFNLMGYAVDPQSKAIQGRELAARDIPIYRAFAGNVSGASVRTSYDQLVTPYLRFGKSIKEYEDEDNFAAIDAAFTRQPHHMMIADFAADMERDRIKARREINEIQDDPYMDDASKVAVIKQLRDEEQVLMNLTIQQIREMERQAGL